MFCILYFTFLEYSILNFRKIYGYFNNLMFKFMQIFQKFLRFKQIVLFIYFLYILFILYIYFIYILIYLKNNINERQ